MLNIEIILKDKGKNFNEDGIILDEKLTSNLYEIRYLYKTKRKNLKEKSIKVLSQNDIDAKCKFVDYINNLNKKYPYRAISNVNILDIKIIGIYDIHIGI